MLCQYQEVIKVTLTMQLTLMDLRAVIDATIFYYTNENVTIFQLSAANKEI